MGKLRVVLAAVAMAMGCETAPKPDPEKVAAEKAAAPKGTCFCKSDRCLCAHCSTGKGDCNCKR